MDIKTLEETLEFDLYGVSGDVANVDFAGTGMKLMNEMWKEIRAAGLKHNGINCWVYDSATRMFAGVELIDPPSDHGGLEHKHVSLNRYAYYKHVGSYEKLGDVHRGMEREMAIRGLEEIGPRVEKYGHWTEDESQLITDVYIGVK